MSEFTELFTAVVSASSVAGAGIVWLWNRVEKRFAEIEVKLKECEDRESEGHARRAKHLVVIEMLFQEVIRLTAGRSTPVLNRARALIKELQIENDDDER